MSDENARENSDYWAELCGTAAANSLGFDMSTIEGQDMFDSWYMDFYGYLFDFVDKLYLPSDSVVEVGLGLGTLSRYLASRVTRYTGIDVAEKSTEYVSGTLSQRGINCKFYPESILNLDSSFSQKYDFAVAIGSLHHTGDLFKAMHKVHELVKPGGRILVMVYNEFEFRRWIRFPVRTPLNALQGLLTGKSNWVEVDPLGRGANDSNSDGLPAPFTSYSSKRFFDQFSSDGIDYEVSRQNFHDYSKYGSFFKRENLLGWPSKILGCDLYAVGRKSIFDERP